MERKPSEICSRKCSRPIFVAKSLEPKNGGQCRTRTCDLLLVSRKDAISLHCCQLLLIPKNQSFAVFWFVSDCYPLLLITVQGPRYSPRYQIRATKPTWSVDDRLLNSGEGHFVQSNRTKRSECRFESRQLPLYAVTFFSQLLH
jgi:hypothetical protein